MNKLFAFATATLLLLAGTLSPIEPAHAGYHIFLDCDHGLGLAPNGPNPNIVCEFYWEDTGPIRVNHGSWSGTLEYNANPAIRDQFTTGIFPLRTTTQPLQKWISCSDVVGPVTMTVYGYSYESEGKTGSGYVMFDFISNYAVESITNSPRCT